MGDSLMVSSHVFPFPFQTSFHLSIYREQFLRYYCVIHAPGIPHPSHVVTPARNTRKTSGHSRLTDGSGDSRENLDSSASSHSWSNSELGLSIMVSLCGYQVSSLIIMETETHRQRPVLIIGSLCVQGPRAAQAGAGGREEREGHLANTFNCQLTLRWHAQKL